MNYFSDYTNACSKSLKSIARNQHTKLQRVVFGERTRGINLGRF